MARYNARVIRAYIPWYLVRNYLIFAFIACLGALQLAAAYRNRSRPQRARYAIAAIVLAGAPVGFYALAPELLTPGPAGGEMTFLFAGAALLAIIASRAIPKCGLRIAAQPSRPDAPGNGAPLHSPPATQTLLPSLKFEIWYLTFPLVSLVIILFDAPLFHALNSLALRTPLIDVPVQFLMNDYIVPTGLVLTLLALWFAGRDDGERTRFQRTVLLALLAMALASIALRLVNEVIFRPRPFAFDDGVRLLFYHPSDSSLPSNAATVCFSLGVMVWLRQKLWGRAMLAMGAGMTLARIIGGVHYPADIVAGAWLGVCSAWLVHRIKVNPLLEAVIGLARRLRLA